MVVVAAGVRLYLVSLSQATPVIVACVVISDMELGFSVDKDVVLDKVEIAMEFVTGFGFVAVVSVDKAAKTSFQISWYWRTHSSGGFAETPCGNGVLQFSSPGLSGYAAGCAQSVLHHNFAIAPG